MFCLFIIPTRSKKGLHLVIPSNTSRPRTVEIFSQTISKRKPGYINGLQCANNRPSADQVNVCFIACPTSLLLQQCHMIISLIMLNNYPDNASSLEHHPSSVHAWQLSPLQISSVGTFNSLIHLLRATGNHLTQHTACRNKICRLPKSPAQILYSIMKCNEMVDENGCFMLLPAW